MNRKKSQSQRIGVFAFAALLAIGGFWQAGMASAAEEATVFLEELRARGYYDTANEYLDMIAKTDLVDDEFKKSIPYEQALNLKSEAQTKTDPRVRDTTLMEAIEKFKDFAKSQPNHSKATSVKMEIGNVYNALAQARILDADKPGADRAKLLAEARKMFTDAQTEFVEAEAIIQKERAVVEKLEKPTKEQEERRDFLRQEWVRSEIAQAQLVYNLSKTYEDGSEEKKAQLTKAAEEWGKLYDKHRTRLIGLYFCVEQGHCLVDMGDYDGAHNCLADLWEQEEKLPQVRALKLEALRWAMRAWIAQKKFDDALLMRGMQLKPGEDEKEAGLDVMLSLARANKLKGDSINDPIKEREKKAFIAKAEKLGKEVLGKSKAFPDVNKDARLLLEELDVKVATLAPKNFDEAYDRAAAAMQKRTLAASKLDKADAEQKPLIQEQIDAATDEAFEFFRMANGFADNDTDLRKLANAQKALCYLYYDRGDHLRAAVVGNYLAENYPQDGATAKFGTWIAMNAFLSEYGRAWKDTKFEVEHIKKAAKTIVEKWPDSSEAVECNYRLIIFAVHDREVDAAVKYLAGIPEDSPRRAKAELTVGQSLWRDYANSVRLPDGDPTKPSEEALDNMLDQAEKVLVAGITRMEAEPAVSSNLVGAAYSLSQLYAGTSRPADAIRLFENPKYGPLTLVKKGDPIAKEGNYGIKTMRLALRSYIGALESAKGQTERKTLLDKGMAMVDDLKKAVGTDAQAAERLTQILIEMGVEIEEQIRGIKDPAGKKALSEAFVVFLDEIRNSDSGTTYSSLIWIAETFRSLGNSNDTGEGQANEVASGYYERAAETYESILKRGKDFLKNPRQQTTIQLRLAECRRRMGQYKESLDLLVEILKKKQTNLTVQLSAAETLFDWGSTDASKYTKSILGDYPDPASKNKLQPKYIVWGWRKLATATADKDDFQEYFFTASYYLVKCRYKLALTLQQKDKERFDNLLVAAKQTLEVLHQRFPDLGGDDMKSRFDQLYRQIQEQLGEKNAEGLAAVK